jgi:DNA-directed RNA polymerase subunit L
MEITILEEKKNRLYFEVPGAGHTLCNALKLELTNDEHVKVATYAIRHSETSNPKMIVETDGEVEPRKAIQSAIARLKKSNDKFRAMVKETIK